MIASKKVDFKKIIRRLHLCFGLNDSSSVMLTPLWLSFIQRLLENNWSFVECWVVQGYSVHSGVASRIIQRHCCLPEYRVHTLHIVFFTFKLRLQKLCFSQAQMCPGIILHAMLPEVLTDNTASCQSDVLLWEVSDRFLCVCLSKDIWLRYWAVVQLDYTTATYIQQ